MSNSSSDARLKQLRKERKDLENRKKSVSNIIKKIDKKPVNDVDNIRSFANSTATALPQGVKGAKRINTLADACRSKARTACALDQWDEKSKLNLEVKRIERRIEDIDREIRKIEAEMC